MSGGRSFVGIQEFPSFRRRFRLPPDDSHSILFEADPVIYILLTDPIKLMRKSQLIRVLFAIGAVLLLSAQFSNGDSASEEAIVTSGSNSIRSLRTKALALELEDIWFIGDSITQSNADGDGAGSPRKSLYDLFVLQNVSFSYTGHFTANVDGLPSSGSTAATNLYRYHSGISGSVIGNNSGSRVGMTQNMDRNRNFWFTGRLATVKPEIILIMLGTNDVAQQIDLANAPARISVLVDKILSLRGVGNPAIFVASIPPNRRSRIEISNVASFNAALPDVVASQRIAGRDIYLVDMFTVLNGDYANAMRPDNLHPNSVGNDHIGQAWFDAIMHRFAPAPGTSFADWQTDNFGSVLASEGAPESNPDGDLHDNFHEFVFGGDPNVRDDNLREPAEFDGAALRMTRREPSSASLSYTLEESLTLEASGWSEVTDADIEVLATEGDFERVEFTRPGGFLTSPSNFYRLGGEESSP